MSDPNWPTVAEHAANFVRGVKLGASEWGDVRDLPDTVYGPPEGFVYFIGIGSPYTTHVKVGFTAGDPRKRVASLQTGCPFRMQLLGYVFGCRAMEAELHSVLQYHRCEGEWFEFAEYVETIVAGKLMQQYEESIA